MRHLCLIVCAAAWLPALISKGDDPVVVLISGDTLGYLSPCGCTKPMLGGIRRRAEAFRALSAGNDSVILDNGGMAKGSTRQDRLKAEALAEAFDRMNVDAVNLCGGDAKLGESAILSAIQLSGNRFVSASIAPSATNPIPETKPAGPFLVGGVASNPEALGAVLREDTFTAESAVEALTSQASESDLIPILLLDGDRKEAIALAQSNPVVSLIVYRSGGDPTETIERIGETVLVSPGQKGTHVLRLTFEDGQWKNLSAIRIGPEFKNDPAVDRVFRRYIAHVTEERLLDKMPRISKAEFAGSMACKVCHGKIYALWTSSKHARALATLEREGQSRDPDCVGCHVVGLDRLGGFRSRAATPRLSDVGCESCHGPARAHAKRPKSVQMKKAGTASCAKCHDTEHSPGFDFDSFWQKIKH